MTERDAKPANVANPADALASLAGIAGATTPAETTAEIQRGRPFQPGQSGNPFGRPRGAKNRLTELLLNVIVDDFAQHGADAIAMLRQQDPAMYLRLVSSLVPRELILEREQQPSTDYADLSYDEAAALINAERKRKLIRGAIEGA